MSKRLSTDTIAKILLSMLIHRIPAASTTSIDSPPTIILTITTTITTTYTNITTTTITTSTTNTYTNITTTTTISIITTSNSITTEAECY